MSLVADPVAKARKAKTELQAARLKEELEVELIYNEQLPDGWERQADEALAILNRQFDDLDGVDTTGGKRVKGKAGQTVGGTWSPTLSSGAKRGAGAPSDRPAGDASDPRGDRPARPTRRPATAAPAARRPRPRRRSGRAERAFRQTGIPAAASSSSRTALQLLGMTLGLTLLYVVLRNPRAVETAGSVVAGAAQVLIAPVNPLAPNRHQAAAVRNASRAVNTGVAAGVAASQINQSSRPRARPRRSPRTAGLGWTP